MKRQSQIALHRYFTVSSEASEEPAKKKKEKKPRSLLEISTSPQSPFPTLDVWVILKETFDSQAKSRTFKLER